MGTFSSLWFTCLIDKAFAVFFVQHCCNQGPSQWQVNWHSNAFSQRNCSLWSGWTEHCQVPPQSWLCVSAWCYKQAVVYSDLKPTGNEATSSLFLYPWPPVKLWGNIWIYSSVFQQHEIRSRFVSFFSYAWCDCTDCLSCAASVRVCFIDSTVAAENTRMK